MLTFFRFFHITSFLIYFFPLITFPCATDSTYCEIINFAINEQYEKAFALADSILKESPAHPAPFFFRAAVFHSMMLDFESNRWEDQFFSNLLKVQQICDSLLQKNPDNAEALFYYGSALSYKGLHLSRSGKYLQGITLSIRAVHTLERVLQLDPSWRDACLAVGSYKYWRSHLTRNFAWLPFFPDQREAGIIDIQKAYFSSKFSKWVALSNLGWIYIQEKRFVQAEVCADEGLTVFPNSRFFLWLKAEALAKQSRFEKAVLVYQKLLDSIRDQEFNNHYNEITLHLKLARCFLELQNNEKALFHARCAGELTPKSDAPRRVIDKQKEANRLRLSLEQ